MQTPRLFLRKFLLDGPDQIIFIGKTRLKMVTWRIWFLLLFWSLVFL